MDLLELIERLRAGSVRLSEVNSDVRDQLADLGLFADNGTLTWPGDVPPLDAEQLGASGPAVVLGAVDSTNRYLKDLPVSQRPPWLLVTAECQTAGRGRLERRWLSPLGAAIAVSLAVPLRCPPVQAAAFSLVTGLAVLEALDPRQQVGLGLKWPNDLNVGNAKVGGILIESLGVRDGATELVVGIGMNLKAGQALSQSLDREVADLESLGVDLDRNRLLNRLRTVLRAFAERFEATGFAGFREAFDAVHVAAGQKCVMTGGGEALSGRVFGVAEDGALLLETSRGRLRIEAGELSLRVT